MNKTRVNLDHPIEIDDNSVAFIELRRPIVGDLVKVFSKKQASNYEQEADLVALLSDRTRDEIDLIDVVDFKKFQKIIIEFLTPGKTPLSLIKSSK